MDKYLNTIVNTSYNKIINRCGVEILSVQDINNLDIQWEDLPLEIQGDCLPAAYEIRLNSNIKDFDVLVDTMVHELVHYFVYLTFDMNRHDFMNTVYDDDSNIFMMLLAWISPGENNSNMFWNDFKHSDLYLTVKKCKSFIEVFELAVTLYNDEVNGE